MRGRRKESTAEPEPERRGERQDLHSTRTSPSAALRGEDRGARVHHRRHVP